MNNTTKAPYILHLPKWYPNSNDPQNGSFIRKHILATAGYVKAITLFISSSPDITGKCKIVSFEKDNFAEHVVLYRKTHKTPAILKNLRFFLGFIMGFKAITKTYGKPDIIHVHVLLHFGIFALILKTLFNIPYLVSEHWSGYINGEYNNKSLIYRYLCRLVIEKSAGITAVSEMLGKGMVSAGFNKPIIIIPNVIDPPLSNPKIVYDSKRKMILAIGDLIDKTKNISGIINAFHELKDVFPDHDLHIIGDGPDKPLLEKLASQLKILNQRVFFQGRKTNREVYYYYPVCQFVIVNSNYETFSMITAEALAHNKPVIATRCGGPELFINEKNGLLVPVGNHFELIEAIKKMISNFEYFDLQDFSSDILKNYSSIKIGKDFMAIYTKIADIS